MKACWWAAVLWLIALSGHAEVMNAERLGVLFNRDSAASRRIALLYAAQRKVPAENLVGLSLPKRGVIDRNELRALRESAIAALPASVQSLLLVWSQPFAVECMSITTAMAVGYRPGMCEPGCNRTEPNPLYDSDGWLPADTTGWLPAMLLPSEDEGLARSLIERGIQSDGSRPPGTVYLVRTGDAARDVRAEGYRDVEALVGKRIQVRELLVPVEHPDTGIIAYFTGTDRVEDLKQLSFRPGGIADHLTSFGGVLDGSAKQMPIIDWLRQGAVASYGTVSEPCNHIGKFPSPAVFLDHYRRGETVLEAYWKSVSMPGQGLFVGEPLARPFGQVH